MKTVAFALLLPSIALACGGPSEPASAPPSAPPSATEIPPPPEPAPEGHGHGAHQHGGHQHGHGPHQHGGHQHAGHGHGHGAHQRGGHGHSGGYAMDFSAVERFAAHFDGPERDAWQKPDEVVRVLALQPGHTVADLGAGTGYFVAPLSRAVPQGKVIALDAEPNMVRYMQERAQRDGWKNVEVRTVPFDDPTLADSSVDRVLIVNTWHHIGDREAYARKLARSLRPGGAVFIVDFTRESDIGPPAEHRLPPEQVIRELEAGGLAARLVDETLPKQYVVAGTRR